LSINTDHKRENLLVESQTQKTLKIKNPKPISKASRLLPSLGAKKREPKGSRRPLLDHEQKTREPLHSLAPAPPSLNRTLHLPKPGPPLLFPFWAERTKATCPPSQPVFTISGRSAALIVDHNKPPPSAASVLLRSPQP